MRARRSLLRLFATPGSRLRRSPSARPGSTVLSLVLLVAFASTLGDVLPGVAPASAAVAADPGSGWRPPVAGPTVAEFAPPSQRFGPGHRGVDYAADRQTPVRAAGAGRVRFAGLVGGSRHVSVDHGDGVVTTYSFLAETLVAAGDRVQRGDAVGRGATSTGAHARRVHFGVVVDGAYVDPGSLLGTPDLSEAVRLVPVERPALDAWADRHDELVDLNYDIHRRLPPILRSDGWLDAQARRRRSGLRKALDATTSFLAEHAHGALEIVSDLEARGNALAHGVADPLGIPLPPSFLPASLVLDVTDAVSLWLGRECEGDAPARGADEIVVANHVMFVGGIDSAGEIVDGDVVANAIPLDETHPADAVHHFSYAGAGQPYDRQDTHASIETSARELRDQLIALESAEGPLEIDLVGHSMGGVVIDTFLTRYYEPARDALPDVASAVTISSPHEGAPLAGALDEMRRGPLADLVERASPTAGAVAVDELSPGSGLNADLADARWPDEVPRTHIGVVADHVVPATSNDRRDGSEHVPTSVWSPDVHGEATTSGAVLDRLAIALTGQVPCATLLEHVGGAVAGNVLSQVEREVGAGLGAG